jgi:hypothetical protein
MSPRDLVYLGQIGYGLSKEWPARRIDAAALVIKYDEAH